MLAASMKLAVRIALYLTLLILAGVSFSQFRRAYQNAPARDVDAGDAAKPPEAVAADTNEVATAAATNEVTATATNSVVDVTTNDAPASVPPAVSGPGASVPAKPADRRSAGFTSLACFLLTMISVGGMGAYDLAQYFGGRAGRSVMAEDYLERKDPEYEEAEEQWAKGNHLDAIQMMRDYLKRNPGEQHVAIRIAEIYEKDLANYLAAALELEEVLNQKLPREKWGWTAIRLSNIYSGRLNQSAKALVVLNRIVTDFSETGAAKKARERLGIPEPTPEALNDEVTGEEPEPEASAPASEPPPEDPNLPKGFRKRK